MTALIFRGGRDPVFPLGHGETLVREVPGAHSLILKGVGHELPPPI